MLRLVKDAPPNTRLFKDNPVELYLAHLDSAESRRTQKQKLETAASCMGATLDDFWLTQLNYTSVSAVRKVLLDLGKSWRTINGTLSAIKGVAKEATNIGLITPEELNKIKSIKAVRGSSELSGRALDADETRALFEACARDDSLAGARDAAMLAMQLYAGLRRDEVAHVNVVDYSSKNRAVMVRGKGNKQRLIPIEAKDARYAIDDWLALYGAREGPLFCRLKGKRATSEYISGQAVYNISKKRAKEAGIPPLSPHDFRRTFATTLDDAGAQTGAISELMGHANVQTTMRYLHGAERRKRKAAALLSCPYRSRRPKPPPTAKPEQLPLVAGPSGEDGAKDSRGAADGR
jgi:integrase/recombinase XerD